MYVLDDSIEGDLLAPATALVRPLLAYPSKLNSYYLMQTFLLAHGEETFLSATYLDPDRRNELAAMSVQLITYPGEYPAGEYYDDVLSLFCDFEGSEVVGIDFSDAALESFGLKTPAYTLYAVNTAVDDDGNPQSLVENFITFSEKQRVADGSEFYYAASYTFGVIARVEQITLDFLEWNLEKWVSPYVFQVNIQNVAVGRGVVELAAVRVALLFAEGDEVFHKALRIAVVVHGGPSTSSNGISKNGSARMSSR